MSVPSEVPALSVIVQVGGERQRSTSCLDSLLRQTLIQQMEILVVDYGLADHSPLVGSDHPSVKLIPRANYESLGRSRAMAVQIARAQIIAFIEEHCVALDGWAEAIRAAHASGWKAIGGEVHSANPGVGISDSIGLMNYWRWLPPAREGLHDLLVGHNTAYDRETLLKLDRPLEELLRCDPVIQWHLQELGIDLYLSSSIKLSHINETEISSIVRGYFLWNRMFAPTRAAVFQWSALKRTIWVLFSPLIAPVRIFKQFRDILNHRPHYLGTFFISMPVQLIAHTAAAAGQAVGLIFGMGDAETSFLHYELNQVRREGRD